MGSIESFAQYKKSCIVLRRKEREKTFRITRGANFLFLHYPSSQHDFLFLFLFFFFFFFFAASLCLCQQSSPKASLYFLQLAAFLVKMLKIESNINRQSCCSVSSEEEVVLRMMIKEYDCEDEVKCGIVRPV